ncbi:transmembrane protein 62 [Lepeophtheirus salmonis]|uniref:transmembrane protein 62 n=1 Tax=Lepeophtheirus salmonis TaxID=72036 RepID=UPI001AE83AC7|nr:transmembrane protein 62-like [Lepeophtheirus salmonis]
MNSIRVMKGCTLLSVFLLLVVLLYLICLQVIAQYQIPRTDVNKEKDSILDNIAQDPPFWFLQISDLHLSKFNPKNPDRDLKKFISFVNTQISPGALLVTGDLTDAKSPYGFGSEQFDVEWRLYHNIMNDFNYTHFMDIRGNHDTFDVPDMEHPRNFFDDYSIQGQSGNSRSYLRIVTHNKKKMCFIGVDATQMPGPKRPFNFIGIIDQDTMSHLKKLSQKASQECDYVFWFGHYPTSTIYSVNPGIRELMASHGFVYVCGHFHTLNNFVTKMYSQHSSGLLELELGDWKDNRLFRIMTVDRGTFSFADFRYNSDEEERPYIVVTQPKDASYVLPSKEPIMRDIDQIRALVFGDARDIFAVIENRETNIKITVPLHRKNADSPLFIGNWTSTKDFKHGAHLITVKAKNSKDKVFTASHLFSFDGSGKYFGIVERILLMSNWITVTQLISGLLTFGLTAILCMARVLYSQKNNLRWLKNRGFFFNFLKNLLILSSYNELLYPLVIYILYIQFGPWAFGYFISDRIGVLFAWGMIIDGSFLPADTTYLFTIFHAILCEIPLIILLSNSLMRERSTKFLKFLYGESGWVVFMLIQFIYIVIFYSSYGLLAVLGPIRIGTLIFSGYLWLRATTLSFNKSRM